MQRGRRWSRGGARANFMRVYGMQQDTGCQLPYQVRDKLRWHDKQEVIPAQAGIQEPYIPLQAALYGARRLLVALELVVDLQPVALGVSHNQPTVVHVEDRCSGE